MEDVMGQTSGDHDRGPIKGQWTVGYAYPLFLSGRQAYENVMGYPQKGIGNSCWASKGNKKPLALSKDAGITL